VTLARPASHRLQALSRGLALFRATTWLDGVLGFTLASLATQDLGTRPIFLFAAPLPLGSISLLLGIRPLPEGHALLSE